MDAEQERQERLYAEDKVRLKAERKRKESQPSVKGFFMTVIYYLGIAFFIFLVGGMITDGYGSNPGYRDPDAKCLNYEKPNGDWANSCDP